MLTKTTAMRLFKDKHYREFLKPPKQRDVTMLREAWNNYTDQLHKDGLISKGQYEYWELPPWCK